MFGTFVAVTLVLLEVWSTAGAPPACGPGCQSEQRASLLALHSALDGQHWSRKDGWGTSQQHCDWEGVRCCGTSLAPADSQTDCPLPGGVAGLDLAVNNLSGTWPDAALQGLSDSLVSLNMRGNNLEGHIPDSISRMRALSVLSVDSNKLSGALPDGLQQLGNLTQVTAASNQLNGQIPAGLVKLRRLRWLILDGNQLTGTAPTELLAAPQMQVLSLQGNKLAGALQDPAGTPATADWQPLTGPRQLAEVRLGSNQLSGSLPAFLAAVPVLLLDLSSNLFTGSVPSSLGSNSVLRELHLQGNRLSGSLPGTLFSGNNLATLDLSNNSITGQLPPSITQLGSLEVLNLASNDLTASDNLPDFLTVDSIPGSMVILDPSAYGYKGCYCLPPFEAAVQQGGAAGGTLSMSCSAKHGISQSTMAKILGPVLALLALALVALACVLMAWHCGLSGLMQRITVEAEKKAPPGSAAKDVTLVLTDVQGSTELWEWDQQLASEAFKIHDRVLRQYMTHFYGYEVSTEGDAFLVAFHEPIDAIAWCLCVQLALHYSDWPEALLLHKSTCLDTADTLELKRRQRQDRWQNQMKQASAPGTHDALGRRLSKGSTTGDAAGIGLDSNAWHSNPGGGDALPPAPLVSVDEHDSGHYGGGVAGGADDNGLEDRLAEECTEFTQAMTSAQQGLGCNILFRGLRVRMSVATGGVDFVRLHSVTQRAEYVGEVLRKVQAVGETPHGGQVMVDAETFKGINSRLPELGGVVLEATQKLLRGHHGPTAEQMAAMFAQPSDNATAVANEYHGNAPINQPLRHSMDVMAVAGGNGSNGNSSSRSPTNHNSGGTAASAAAGEPGHRQYYSAGYEGDVEQGHLAPTAARLPRAQRSVLARAARLLGMQEDEKSSDEASGSILLGNASHVQPQQAALRTRSSLLASMSAPSRRARRNGQGGVEMTALRRRSSLSYGVMVIDMGVHQLSGLPNKVNLTQVMPCGLEDRARFFPRLDSLRQETPGYFDAPAAGLVPLCPGGSAASMPCPSVTIVFCTIDKYPELVDTNREAAEMALELYSDCVRWLLLVGGGYECQEAEGTFMVAFSSADVAIEWCLMVQQVLRDMSWPPCVLELPTCEEERDMHGNIMFRGPRVKMGVYSGTPTQVIPHNTTGRADYFGPLVNRAARYCHAAARGGQVLVPKELMFEVISKWVNIDPLELLQSDRLMEFQAHFDEERRLWPWMFKRRSHWDMPVPPHLYPYPMYTEAQSAGAGWPADSSVRAGNVGVADGGAAAAAAVEQQDTGLDAPSSSRTDHAQNGQQQQQQQQQQQPGGLLAAAAAAALADQQGGGGSKGWRRAAGAAESGGMPCFDLPVEGLEGSQHHSAFAGQQLAVLDEAAEGESSRCASELDMSSPAPQLPQQVGRWQAPGSQQQQQQQLAQQSRQQLQQRAGAGPSSLAAAGVLVGAASQQRRMRRHSDLVLGYSRLGPAVHYSQGTALGLPYGYPPGIAVPGGSYWQQQQQLAAAARAAYRPDSRFRRPSYLSDVSGAAARYRRHSNLSDSSFAYTTGVPSPAAPSSAILGPGGGSGARRLSNLSGNTVSDFLATTANQHGSSSRRPSNLSQGDSWMYSSEGYAPPAAEHITAGAGGGRPGPGLVSGRLSEPWLLQYGPAGQGQQGALAGYDVETSISMAAAAAPGALSGVPRMASGSAGELQQQSQPQRMVSDGSQHSGPLDGATAAAAAVVPVVRSNRSSSSSGAAGAGAASGRGQHQERHAQQQQQRNEYEHHQLQYVPRGSSGNGTGGGAAAGGGASAAAVAVSAPGSAGGSVAAPQSTSTAGTGSRGSGGPGSNLGPTGATSVTGGAGGAAGSSSRSGGPPPVGMLVHGLESQVLPGMLHSSNRLRLVSKRRRQMSYCFFQESCKPGVPADGADPKRLLPAGYSSLYGTPLATSLPSNYAGSETGGPMMGGSAQLATVAQSLASKGTLSSTDSGEGPAGDGGSIAAAGAASWLDSAANLPPGDAPAASATAEVEGSVPPAGHHIASSSTTHGGPTSSYVGGVWGPMGGVGGSAAAAVVDDFCGLPEIEPLPDAEVLESLRLAAPLRQHRPSNLSAMTAGMDSVAGFEGPNIGHMCEDIMRGRWLWLRELLVHDLGQFRFKGVAGVHSIVSVTSEELGGRTFPTTIRRGKGEQIRLGRGLLAMVQMVARIKPPSWSPYAGQQMLQQSTMAAYQQSAAADQGGQQSAFVPFNLCHACGNLSGPATAGGTAAACNMPSCAAGGQGQPQHQQGVDGLTQQLEQQLEQQQQQQQQQRGPAAARLSSGEDLARPDPVQLRRAGSGGVGAAAAPLGGQLPPATWMPQPVPLGVTSMAGAAAGGSLMGPPLRRVGSSGDVRTVGRQYQVSVPPPMFAPAAYPALQHYPSAPEGFAAAAVVYGRAGGGGGGGSSAIMLQDQLPPVPPGLAEANTLWRGVAAGGVMQLPQQQQQLLAGQQVRVKQQQQLVPGRRRRHSVCVAQIGRGRLGMRGMLLYDELQPFEESEEWLYMKQHGDSMEAALAPKQPWQQQERLPPQQLSSQLRLKAAGELSFSGMVSAGLQAGSDNSSFAGDASGTGSRAVAPGTGRAATTIASSEIASGLEEDNLSDIVAPVSVDVGGPAHGHRWQQQQQQQSSPVGYAQLHASPSPSRASVPAQLQQQHLRAGAASSNGISIPGPAMGDHNGSAPAAAGSSAAAGVGAAGFAVDAGSNDGAGSVLSCPVDFADDDSLNTYDNSSVCGTEGAASLPCLGSFTLAAPEPAGQQQQRRRPPGSNLAQEAGKHLGGGSGGSSRPVLGD